MESQKEFLLAEYREAAGAYFEGVQLGYSVFKGYITANGLFVAALGALGEGKFLGLQNVSLLKIIPILALLVSLTMIMALPHYFKHLENCRSRCEALETVWGGALFTRLGRISNGGSALTSAGGMILTVGVIVAFWLGLIFHGHLSRLLV